VRAGGSFERVRHPIDNVTGRPPMHHRSFVLASAAAALFVAGAALPSSAAEEGQIACEGVNACKGQSDCRTASNACSGQNACAGKGFKLLTPEECEQAKAKQASEKK
jgi:hypothetical protein